MPAHSSFTRKKDFHAPIPHREWPHGEELTQAHPVVGWEDRERDRSGCHGRRRVATGRSAWDPGGAIRVHRTRVQYAR